MTDRIRALREAHGWTHQELATRAGVSRQLVGAMESGRHVPNVAAALRVAGALGVTVEELFDADAPPVTSILGDPLPTGAAVVAGRVGDHLVAARPEHLVVDAEQWALVDALVRDGGVEWLPDRPAEPLVVAGCDPVLGIVGGLVERAGPHRLVAVHASTGRSVDALAAGRVHAVVVHAPSGQLPQPPVDVRRWHLASWQVGLAGRGRAAPSIDELAERRARVVQRDPGAGSQQALERELARQGRATALPGPVVGGHVEVARRVAAGGGRAGVTMEAAAIAFDLGFTSLEVHDVELWIDARWVDLPGARAVLDVLAGPGLRRRAEAIAGYDVAGLGREVGAG